ncbi:osmoprotectant transport system permease protein [Saccharopolyspora antimicrobica]|uniref:Osmoprotectant transport system permease protein n=2 Tax=Saccharopolyspora TaxID=1835 RepID=A0A1I5IFT8_9PSEU|nr:MULTISPECIES: ABC transporter permease subunit [Saccharopolyspora]RKT85502.1 osmoprotectant transport system permease protein [Saccharopolyspora antimicrobica]SEG96927.1 osmoprotectant transport system permease protein [Saccharopolyspora kobensis]SFE64820.1 osmoprotectant transport system permease protein [Saccharopolyspora kobensis]SFO59040.1 osmoprotectant transport system permease protein [Saccharopolyspora antimicrobica]
MIDYFGSPSNRELVLEQLTEHIYLALLPLLLGVLLALPLGRLAQRVRWLRGALQGTANVVYTIPSLALFVIIPGLLGTPLLSSVNVVIALTLYTAALLVGPVKDALDSVPVHVVAAATALGYRPARRFLTVELPLSVPVLAAAVRVASVSNISMVSVGALVGIGGLGRLFTDGFQRDYPEQIVIGIVLTLLLALVVDLLLVLLWRLATPWARAGVSAA